MLLETILANTYWGVLGWFVCLWCLTTYRFYEVFNLRGKEASEIMDCLNDLSNLVGPNKTTALIFLIILFSPVWAPAFTLYRIFEGDKDDKNETES